MRPWARELVKLLHRPSKTLLPKLHAHLLVSGSLSSSSTAACRLISAYSSLHDLLSARHVFNALPHRSTASYNALLVALSKRDSPNQLLSLFHSMIARKEAAPDSSTFTLAVRACALLRDLPAGDGVAALAARFGYSGDVFVDSSLLNLYAKCKVMDRAMAKFEEMGRKDIVSWTTMINGFASSSTPFKAVEIFLEMQSLGERRDEVVILGLVQACARLGDMNLGRSVHCHLLRGFSGLDLVTETGLVDMYAKNGLLVPARRLLDRMPRRNIVSWGALISGLSQNGVAGAALGALVEMQEEGFEPDDVALVGALLACSQLGLVRQGKAVHCHAVRRRELDKFAATAVIDMYCKCGNLRAGRLLFDRTSGRDAVLWNAMISSHGLHGKASEALSLFRRMGEEDGLSPDHATFSSLLSALSHCGMVEEGKYWFGAMKEQFGVEPVEKHYACMVDLLARSGRVEEAFRLAETMPAQPGVAVWVALLSGCLYRKKLAVATGQRVAERILAIGSEDLGVYALVSNFFSAAKKWERVAEVRAMMKGMKGKKVPGTSFLEIGGRVHGFLAEDETHPQHEEISRMLFELGEEMKKLGYRPRTEFVLQDVGEHVKSRMLCAHSERIAIAFALLNTAPGEKIVVMKNLRVCGDCHVATKLISKITDREIVVRDSKRFHHFKDGACSCGDFW